MGFTLSTGFQSSPLSSSEVASVTSGSIIGGIKHYRFYGHDTDHDHAAAILAAASSPSDIQFIIEIIPAKVNSLTDSDVDDFVSLWNDMVSNVYCIALGNEPLYNSLNISLLPEKLQLVYDRLQTHSGWENIPVSIPFSGSILGSSWPVVDSTFQSEYESDMASIIEIYQAYNAPFSIQIYPYYAVNDVAGLLDYCLGEESAAGEYSSMLAAQYESINYAMESVVNDHGVEIIITETGWSTSNGDDSDYNWATTANATKFYTNTIRLMNDASPELYNARIYFFELFDEDNKSGGDYEKHFGFFHGNGTLKITDFDDTETVGTYIDTFLSIEKHRRRNDC